MCSLVLFLPFIFFFYTHFFFFGGVCVPFFSVPRFGPAFRVLALGAHGQHTSHPLVMDQSIPSS